MKDFGFDVQKKIQAAAIIARLEGKRVGRMRLLKLLYLADRESLKERGTPILGGRVSALDNGPLHSEVYDMIKADGTCWSDFFRNDDNDGNDVILIAEPGELKLSPFEIGKLTSVFEKFKHVDTRTLVDLTHHLEEWKLTWKEGTSQTIPIQTTLRALGFTSEEIADIVSDGESYMIFNDTLASNTPCVKP